MSLFQSSTIIHGDNQYQLSTDKITSYEIVDDQLQLVVNHRILDGDVGGDENYHISEISMGQWSVPTLIGYRQFKYFSGVPFYLGDTASEGTYKIYFLDETKDRSIYQQEYFPKLDQWQAPEVILNETVLLQIIPEDYLDRGRDSRTYIYPFIFQINPNNSITLGWSFYNQNFDDEFNSKSFIYTLNEKGSILFESEIPILKSPYNYNSDSFFFDYNNRLSFYERHTNQYFTYENKEWTEIDEIKQINSRINRVSELDGYIIESHQIEDSGSIQSHWIHKEVFLRVISDTDIYNISIPFDPPDLRYYEISNIIQHDSHYYVSTSDRLKFQILEIDLDRSTVSILSEYQYADHVNDGYPQKLTLISRDGEMEIYWSEEIKNGGDGNRRREIFSIGFNLDSDTWTQITQVTDASMFTNDYRPDPRTGPLDYGWLTFNFSLFLIILVYRKFSKSKPNRN